MRRQGFRLLRRADDDAVDAELELLEDTADRMFAAHLRDAGEGSTEMPCLTIATPSQAGRSKV